MKIKEITCQHRRDFTAIYVCEGCGHEEKGSGYDDNYFHTIVIPDKRCAACGKIGREVGADYRPLQPKYAEGQQV